jgi:response regulator RpfG family c-di-GMP phosphodiesterase
MTAQNRSEFPAVELGGGSTARPRIIVIDDEPENCTLCRRVLEPEGMACDEAADGAQGLQTIALGSHDLVLLDIDMPGMQGTEVLRQLRVHPPRPHLKIIMLSGRATGDEMARLMRAGADDYLSKPFSTVQLVERVKAALRLKAAQDRSDQLNRNLLTLNHELEQGLLARDSDLIQARNALVLGLAELVGQRDAETGAHLMRLQHYCRTLAEEAARAPGFAGQIDGHFVKMLECCAPLHDIGKVGVSDHILQKPGRLTDEERRIMQRHTVIAAVTLQKVAEVHGFTLAFFQMAVDVARHHHERFDGNGYPDRLAGEDIPLSARIIAVADVYDALRSQRIYKPALPHEDAVRTMLEDSGHFDPAVLTAFQRCSRDFARVFEQFTD